MGLSHYLVDQDGLITGDDRAGEWQYYPGGRPDRSYNVYPRITQEKCVGCGRCYLLLRRRSSGDGVDEHSRTPHCNTEKMVVCLLCVSCPPGRLY